jgi:hypothetical protein
VKNKNAMTTLETRKKHRPDVPLCGVALNNYPARDSRALDQAVRAAVRRITESALPLVATRDLESTCDAQNLLAVLSFCYAREIYSTTDICDFLARDGHLQRLWRREPPGAHVICHFLHANHETIRVCLRSVLWLLSDGGEEAVSMGALSTGRLAEEASRRVFVAMFLNAMEPNAASNGVNGTEILRGRPTSDYVTTTIAGPCQQL